MFFSVLSTHKIEGDFFIQEDPHRPWGLHSQDLQQAGQKGI